MKVENTGNTNSNYQISSNNNENINNIKCNQGHGRRTCRKWICRTLQDSALSEVTKGSFVSSENSTSGSSIKVLKNNVVVMKPSEVGFVLKNASDHAPNRVL